MANSIYKIIMLVIVEGNKFLCLKFFELQQ